MPLRHLCLGQLRQKAACWALLVGIVFPQVVLPAPSASDLYKRGRAFEKAGNIAQAYLYYSQAAAAEPTRREYWLRAQALQTRAATEAKVMPSTGSITAEESESLPVIEPDPEDLREAKRPLPPAELSASPDIKNVDVRGNSRELWEQVAKLYGIELIFDGDYQDRVSQRLRLEGVGYREAFDALMAATSSFVVPLAPHLAMVAADTEQKRREAEASVAVSIPIPDPLTLADAQEMARAVQQLMEIQRFAIDSVQRVVILRDRASKIEPAKAVLHQLMLRRAQVGIEIELVSIPRQRSYQWGLGLPTSFPVTSLYDAIKLTGGPLTLAVGIGSAQLLAKWSESTTTTLLRAEMRSLDGLAATFHAGEKYPIATSTYAGPPPDGDDPVFIPPPIFNYEDLGLILKVTPKVHDRNEVSLEIEAEYKLLGPPTANGNPIIANRKMTTRVRLGFDQWAIIGGLVNAGSTRSFSGLAGLGNIPVLGTILGRSERSYETSETLLVLKPRLLHLPPTEFPAKTIFIGSESRLRIPL